MKANHMYYSDNELTIYVLLHWNPHHVWPLHDLRLPSKFKTGEPLILHISGFVQKHIIRTYYSEMRKMGKST